MAFIREVKRGFYANGRPKRYYYLVETYRENGKVKQRQRYLGKEKPKRWGRGAGLPFLTKADEEMIAKAKRDRNPLMNRAGQLARSLAYRLDELDGQGYLYDGGPLSKFMIHSFFVASSSFSHGSISSNHMPANSPQPSMKLNCLL